MNISFINEITNIDWKDGIKKIPNSSIDLVVTDPPYGMNYQSNMRKEKHLKIQNDDNLDWLEKWVVEMDRVTKDDSHLYIFCSWHNIDIFKSTIDRYMKIKNILIWDKKSFGMGDLEGDYAPSYEMILFISKGKKKLNGGRSSNILRGHRTKNENHPTEKPVGLIKFLVEKSSNKGDLVLDTFAGSFPTAQACKDMGRDFISFEIEESYCRIAKKLLDGTLESLF